MKLDLTKFSDKFCSDVLIYDDNIVQVDIFTVNKTVQSNQTEEHIKRYRNHSGFHWPLCHCTYGTGAHALIEK